MSHVAPVNRASVLPHERYAEEEGYQEFSAAQAMAMRWAAAFSAMFKDAERHSDSCLLEDYYSTLATFRQVCPFGTAPHSAFFAFRQAAETLMRQRVNEAGLWGFDAGYAAAVLALTGQPITPLADPDEE